MDQTDFAELLRSCAEVAELCSQGAVFIGGIAVYLHAINVSGTETLAATTHDADLFLFLWQTWRICEMSRRSLPIGV